MKEQNTEQNPPAFGEGISHAGFSGLGHSIATSIWPSSSNIFGDRIYLWISQRQVPVG